MRGDPQSGFSILIRRISVRRSASICGRPPRIRDFHRQEQILCRRDGRRVLPSSVSTHHQLREILMEARVVSNLAPAAAHDGAVRCLLAIDLSKKSWVAAVNTPLSDKISLHKLKPCDWKELLQLIERIRKRIAQELKKPVEVISCYEAGYDGFWLHRLLEAQGVRNHVID